MRDFLEKEVDFYIFLWLLKSIEKERGKEEIKNFLKEKKEEIKKIFKLRCFLADS